MDIGSIGQAVLDDLVYAMNDLHKSTTQVLTLTCRAAGDERPVTKLIAILSNQVINVGRKQITSDS